MRGAITFQPLTATLNNNLMAAIVECRDCGDAKTTQYAIMHQWGSVERELGSQVYVTEYLCAYCCEARVHDYNATLEEQANDL
jgi:hypothetical protein